MGRKPVPLNIKVQHTDYNPERDKANIKAIKKLLASALFELYKKDKIKKENDKIDEL